MVASFPLENLNYFIQDGENGKGVGGGGAPEDNREKGAI